MNLFEFLFKLLLYLYPSFLSCYILNFRLLAIAEDCEESFSSRWSFCYLSCFLHCFSLPSFSSCLHRCGCIFCLPLLFFVLLMEHTFMGAVYSPRILTSLLVILKKEESDCWFVFYFLYLLLYKICIIHTFEYNACVPILP